MEKGKRTYVLIAGMIIQFCAGIIYMWSVFKAPVAEHLNWDANAAALTSSIMLCAFVLGIVFGGKLQDVFGPKKLCIVGSLFIGAGMALTAVVPASAPYLVYVTYGIIGGLGVGTVYTSTVSAIQKWFPDKRGFATGMTVSAFGFSLVVFAPLATRMLESLGVPGTFLAFAVGFLAVCLTCSLFIRNPPEGYTPAGFTAVNRTALDKKQYTTGEMLKTREYYLTTGALFFTLPAYFILNPQFMTFGMDRGLPQELAVLGVMITGVASASGRLLISWASDRLGRKVAMLGIAALTILSTLILLFANGALFLICIALISFAFGGASGVYTAVTADLFGTKHMGTNYGCVMIGFGLSALLFPLLSSALASGGNYEPSLLVAAGTCVAALLCIAWIRLPREA